MDKELELAAQIAEAVRASLKPDLEEIKNRLIGVEEELKKLNEKIEENEIVTAFLTKDVYLLKNKAK